MNWSELENFDAYDKEIPCVICKKPAKPTVAGNNFKCWDCGHIFKEDSSKIVVECHCKVCAPEHDPLKGKTKGKKTELQLPPELNPIYVEEFEKKIKKKKILRRNKKTNKRLK